MSRLPGIYDAGAGALLYVLDQLRHGSQTGRWLTRNSYLTSGRNMGDVEKAKDGGVPIWEKRKVYFLLPINYLQGDPND